MKGTLPRGTGRTETTLPSLSTGIPLFTCYSVRCLRYIAGAFDVDDV